MYQREPTISLAFASLSAYAKQQIPGISVFLENVTEGDDPREYGLRISRHRPQLIAASIMSPHWPLMDPYLRELQRVLPEVPLLVGGYQAIVSPERTLAHPAVDFVCPGDGEFSLVELIRKLEGHSPSRPLGLWTKEKTGAGRRILPEIAGELNQMPMPDYFLYAETGDIRRFGPHASESKALRTLPVMSGRGCPYRCAYCGNTFMLNLYRGVHKYLRKYDPARLAGELARLKSAFGIEYFHFWDELLAFDRRYTDDFLNCFREQVCTPFSMFQRVELMDDRFCRTAAAAGCHSVWFGVESGSEAYRRRYLNRNMTNAEILEAARTAAHFGIKRMTFNMIGMPFETQDDMLATLRLNQLIQPELFLFCQYLPLPGTPLYAEAERAGLLLAESPAHQMSNLGCLNLRPYPGGPSVEEMREIADRMMQFAVSNNAYDS